MGEIVAIVILHTAHVLSKSLLNFFDQINIHTQNLGKPKSTYSYHWQVTITDPIASSTAVSKAFECILLEYVVSNDDIDMCLFGFKEGFSAAICTNVLKTAVEYYTSRSSHVFSCFVDFNKAFDRVKYWRLFTALLNDGVNTCIVSLLAYWYSNHAIAVKLLHVIFDSFYQ